MIFASASSDTDTVARPGHGIAYLIGVDAGGSGTRLCIASSDGQRQLRGAGRPAALSLGRRAAWEAILDAVEEAFQGAGFAAPHWAECAVGLGLAGAHNRGWAAEFASIAPDFAEIKIDTDGFTALLGAHRGRPGAIITVGTGSAGEILHDDGSRREIGGWGYPAGDEASGSWLGMRAVRHAEQVLDGRTPATPFSEALLERCGRTRDALAAWLAQANQTAYAQLAPIVVAHAARDRTAKALLHEAGEEVAKMARALDPQGRYPLALCGGLGESLKSYLPDGLLKRVVTPAADSATGALYLIANHLNSPLQQRLWTNSKP